MHEKGDTVVDEARGERVGVIQDIIKKTLWLRPIGGGREWEVSSEYCRPATRAEILSAKTAVRNRLSTEYPQ